MTKRKLIKIYACIFGGVTAVMLIATPFIVVANSIPNKLPNAEIKLTTKSEQETDVDMDIKAYSQYTVALASLKVECTDDQGKTVYLEFVKDNAFDYDDAIAKFKTYTGYNVPDGEIFPDVDHPLNLQITDTKNISKTVRFQAQVLYQDGNKKYTQYSNIVSYKG
ncbi:MAG: hypothetical protein LBF00_00710 [Mycoplasmataceae bacterium]|jgi:hypothetical protein|nr:hypothetical protein [Mycoplasmataceae bacterium]